MNEVVKVINSIKKSALKSRMFEKVCEGMDANHKNLLFYSAVRWLSRGRVLSRIYSLKEEVVVFLTLEESTLDFVGNDLWWMRVAFLADLYDHLNKLNSSLQGCNENLLTAADKM